MGCNDLGPPLMLKDFEFDMPQGNTYAITISPYDHIAVTVQHPELPIKTMTLISPQGIRHHESPKGKKLVYETDFSFRKIDEC